jgi:predicted aconitase with swiveling domain
MRREPASRGAVPLGIVFNTPQSIPVQGAAFGDIPWLAGVGSDTTARQPHGAWVEIDPAGRTLHTL